MYVDQKSYINNLERLYASQNLVKVKYFMFD